MSWLAWLVLIVFVFVLTYNPRSGVLNKYLTPY